jgi:hypothetical protein
VRPVHGKGTREVEATHDAGAEQEAEVGDDASGTWRRGRGREDVLDAERMCAEQRRAAGSSSERRPWAEEAGARQGGEEARGGAALTLIERGEVRVERVSRGRRRGGQLLQASGRSGVGDGFGAERGRESGWLVGGPEQERKRRRGFSVKRGAGGGG